MARLAAFLVVMAVGATFAALAGGAAAGPVRATTNSVTFPDSAGEDPAAPDITSITVSNNDAGLIQFRIEIPNRPTLTDDMIVLVFLDTDDNQATGETGAGTDYAIQLVAGSVRLFRWDGTTYSSAGVSQTSLIYSYSNGATISISANELNATKRFKVAVIATSGITVDASGNPDFTNTKNDQAPDQGHGLYTYDVKVTPLTLVVKRVSTVPLKPRAGSQFTVSLVAARSDSGATIQSGTVTCKATIAFKPIVARIHRVSGGKAVCTFQIPKTARGKTIRVAVALQFEGLTAKGSYSGKIL